MTTITPRYEERLAVSVTNLAKTSLEADRLQKVEISVLDSVTSVTRWRTSRTRAAPSRARRMTGWSSN